MLGVDMHSNEWRAVTAYCKRRCEELTGVCTSVTASHADRERAAWQIEELQRLLRAPQRALQTTEQADTATRGMY